MLFLLILPYSESHTFNKLESIATSPKPTTPVLGCHIVKALELEHVRNEVCTTGSSTNMGYFDVLHAVYMVAMIIPPCLSCMFAVHD